VYSVIVFNIQTQNVMVLIAWLYPFFSSAIMADLDDWHSWNYWSIIAVNMSSHLLHAFVWVG